ncbi:MAG: efflux RND transporter periplasmic adaptor subunit [Holosporaceae bacterium]|jgi:membrane fusion protein (multidrug efflux system)|nr:efflux RND transporter periplasmic adaptor subunit [Holosporaceae bacterium]
MEIMEIKATLLKRKKAAGLVVFALVLSGFIAYKILGNKSLPQTFAPPTITVSKAILGPVVKYINAIGTLRPFDSVVIKSEVNAKIEKIHFSEGAMVNENDLLIELDDSTAKASLMEAEAQYRKAKSEFDPIEKLTDKGIAARIQRDTKKAEMDMAAARVNSYKTALEKHKILAPFGGLIGLREISRGQFVTPGTELIKLVDCHPLKVDFKVAEVDIGNIYVDQKIKILVGGDKTQEYVATIIAIDPESDKISHSFDVRAILDVSEDVAVGSQALKPGRFISVQIALDAEQKGILIPESAMEKVGEEDMVFRVSEGIAVRTLVTPGMRLDGNVEIITGLNDGDLVITSGQGNVLDGREVSIQDSQSFSEITKAMSEIYQKQKKTPSATKGKI